MNELAVISPRVTYPSLSLTNLASRLTLLTDAHNSGTFVGVEIAKELGIKNLRLRLDASKMPPEAVLKQFSDKCSESGVGINSAVIVFPGCDYSNVEKARETVGFMNLRTVASRLRQFEKAAEVVGKFGIRLITTHFGEVPANGDRFHEAVNIANALKRICRDKGVKLALEVGQEDPVRLALMLVRVKGGESLVVGANLDTANLYSYGNGELMPAFRILGDFILGVDLKDTKGSKGGGTIAPSCTQLGEGVVPFREAMRKVVLMDCPVLLEQNFGDSPDKQRGALKETLAYIESTLRI